MLCRTFSESAPSTTAASTAASSTNTGGGDTAAPAAELVPLDKLVSPTTAGRVREAIKRDLAPPHACRAFTGYVREQGKSNDPQGTVVRCVLNTAVPCTMTKFLELGKHKRIAATVLYFPKLGWGAAPYKKAKAGSAAKKSVASNNNGAQD